MLTTTSVCASKACLVWSHSLFQRRLTLLDTFKRLEVLFRGITPQQLSVFRAVRQCDGLIGFFRDNHFHSEEGKARFQGLRQEITLRIRNDAFKNGLFNDLLTAHRCLAPFIQQNIPLRSVLELASRMGDVVSAGEVLKQANDNIAQVNLSSLYPIMNSNSVLDSSALRGSFFHLHPECSQARRHHPHWWQSFNQSP